MMSVLLSRSGKCYARGKKKILVQFSSVKLGLTCKCDKLITKRLSAKEKIVAQSLDILGFEGGGSELDSRRKEDGYFLDWTFVACNEEWDPGFGMGNEVHPESKTPVSFGMP
jgi:hypothetical protein